MKTTLFDLWNGNLCPAEEFTKGVPEIKELEKLLEANAQKLLTSLSKEQKERFEIYNKCIEEYWGYTNEEAFYYGFGLAVKLIIETYN